MIQSASRTQKADCACTNRLLSLRPARQEKGAISVRKSADFSWMGKLRERHRRGAIFFPRPKALVLSQPAFEFETRQTGKRSNFRQEICGFFLDRKIAGAASPRSNFLPPPKNSCPLKRSNFYVCLFWIFESR